MVRTVNSVSLKRLERCPLFRVPFIKRFHCIPPYIHIPYTPIHTHPLYPHTYTSLIPPYIHLSYLLSAEVDGGWQYQIAVVADPDTNSKVGDKDLWRSYLLKGRVNVVATGSGGYSVSVTWDKDLVSESV